VKKESELAVQRTETKVQCRDTVQA